MSQLEDLLEQKAEENDCTELFNSYQQMKNKLDNEYYGWIQANCSYFTDHGKEHINSVVKRSEEILEKELESSDSRLNILEVYLLLSSIIWHDVGMVINRANHEEKVSEITEELKSLFPKIDIRRSVEDITRAHTGNEDQGIEQLKDNRIMYEHDSYRINTPALAAILRFADELSENRDRVSSSQVVTDTVPEESRIFWEYAKSIKSSISQPSRNRCLIDIELEVQEAISKYKCIEYPNICDDEGRLTLIEYIICRLEKMNNERHYCAPEFKIYADLSEIVVRFTLLEEDRPISPEYNQMQLHIGQSGLLASPNERPYPDIDLYDEFFEKYNDLCPDNLEEMRR